MVRTIKWTICVVALVFVLGACSSGPSLKPDKTTVKRGGEVTVAWTAPSSFAKNAWIGIIPSKIPHGSEATNDEHDVTYLYLNGKTSGTFVFTVPKKKGAWDVRMHDTDSNGKEVASVTLTVN